MEDSGVSQSALARHIGVDRSTVSQLLTDEGARLPNAHVVGSCASALGVSADWLLSLSDRPESAAELLASSLTMTEAPRALVDERIFQWHQEAAGYKIRYVPATLPDMLKTRAILEWEYAPHLGRTADQAIGASEDRLSWMRSAQSDYEIAMPLYEIRSFALGTGYYEGLPLPVRLEQIDHLLDLSEQHYPRLRDLSVRCQTPVFRACHDIWPASLRLLCGQPLYGLPRPRPDRGVQPTFRHPDPRG